MQIIIPNCNLIISICTTIKEKRLRTKRKPHVVANQAMRRSFYQTLRIWKKYDEMSFNYFKINVWSLTDELRSSLFNKEKFRIFYFLDENK